MPDLLRPILPLPVAGTRLRPWQVTDAADLVACANDPGIAQNLRDAFPYPYQARDARWYLDFVLGPQSVDIHLAIEVDGAAAGAVSIVFKQDIERRSAEIGYWLARRHWGRGIVTAATRTLTQYALANFDLCRLYAQVFAHNTASGRVLEKCGYELEGRLRKSITKNGQTTDGLLYSFIS